MLPRTIMRRAALQKLSIPNASIHSSSMNAWSSRNTPNDMVCPPFTPSTTDARKNGLNIA